MSPRGKSADRAPRAIAWQGPTHGTVETDEGRRPFTAVAAGGAVWVRFGGRTYVVAGPTAQDARSAGAGQGWRQPVSPLPGVVLSVVATEGERVASGDILVTIEAMKMEHEIRAGAAGRVESIHVRKGQRVEAGTRLCTLRAEGGGEA